MNKNYLVWGVVVLGAVLIGYYLVRGYSKPSKEMQTTNAVVAEVSPTTVSTNATTSTEVMAKATVDYTESGFTPKTITVKVGESVIWANKGTKPMWVASAVHPTHQVYPEFDQKTSVPNGGSYTFTFTRVGSWKYHNHMSPSDIGTVVVE